MAENKISIEIPAAEYQAIMEHLNNAQAALSKYVIALTPAQRMGLPKLGDKTLAFVNKTAEYANSQSKFVPSYLDKADALKYQAKHRGFAAWWLLQHTRGYKPFVTKVIIKSSIGGRY
jgi:hypothetical protein